jgi:3-methyladenine DNA glycosylase AlkC
VARRPDRVTAAGAADAGRASHPALRFKAPSTIRAGTPLKELIGPALVRLISESFARTAAGFRRREFEREAVRGLSALEFTGRSAHVARALAGHLPRDFGEAAGLLVASLGPELERTEGNGLAPFFYAPHAHYIALFGLERFEPAMRANCELTKRFTAEFSVRPFLVRYPGEALERLRAWTADPNPHVRRLVSEGTRPRLPWAPRLAEFRRDPSPVLELLERLKDDPVLYVRRSVANSLGDIAKDHPDRVFRTCRRWLEELSGLDAARADARRRVIRHAVRLPARKGIAEALRIRQAAL